MPDPIPPPSSSPLADGLRLLLHTGLPVDPRVAAPALLALPGVGARAVDPDDAASRARALDGLLRWQLARLAHELAPAARVLFGATDPGVTLTERRARAAETAGYEVHHFRKRIEPKLCRLLAEMLAADAEEFAAIHAAPPTLAAVGSGPLRLPADIFAWEAAEHERMLSLLWSGVYALRAQLLELARLASMDAPGPEARAGAEAALWAYGQLLATADEYRASYGEALLHADTRLAPRQLARLAGWIPPLEEAAADRLAAAARTTATAADFLARVPDADRDAWHTALLPLTPIGRTPA